MKREADGRKVEKRAHGLLVMVASCVLAAALTGVGWASVCTVGVTPFLELDSTATVGANCGFDMLVGSSFDWANGGANATPRACSPLGNGVVQSCSGAGGVFNDSSGCTAAGNPDPCCTGPGAGTCGAFVNSTTPPIAPAETPTAMADPTIVDAEFGVDPLSVDVTPCGTGDPTVYTGAGGETNGDPIPSETFGTGSVPNKDEISNVYAISHQSPANPDLASCAGCTPNACSPACAADSDCTATNEIFAGFERVVNNGDSHVDLEFLQSAVNLAPGSKPAAFPCAGNFKGDRTQGDILLSVDFTKGGKVGAPVIHKWVCGNLVPPPSGVCNPTPGACSLTTTTPCSTNNDCPSGETCVRKGGPHYEEVTSGIVTAAVKQRFNGAGATGCGGWACRNADGTQTGTVGQVEFYEVGIDLAALGFSGCIHTFLPHTRSSQSFTSTLKDFELISFNTCFPKISATKTCTSATVNSTGDGVTVNFGGQVCNDGNVTLSNITLSDDPAATFDPSSQCLQPGFTLPPKPVNGTSCCTYSGSYTSTTCGNTDTVTVNATSQNGPISTTATPSDLTACMANCTPSLTVSKDCTAAVNTAGDGVTVSFNGQVCNTGNVKLTGISLTDDKGGVSNPPCTTLAPAPAGGSSCCGYSGSYSASQPATCSFTDKVTVTASNALTADQVMGMDDATCSASPVARISATKSCMNHLVSDPSTGHLVDQVDFSGTVCASRSGTQSDVKLTGVTVSDDKGGITSNNCSTLARGACCQYSGTYFPTDPSTCTATDTVTVSGSGICGTSDTNSQQASCTLCQ